MNRNPTDFHTEIEQAAFEPNNLVPGIGLSPDKMLLARVFSYADAHRARLGVNYKQIPVNAPQGRRCTATARMAQCGYRTCPIRSMRLTPRAAPQADPERYPYMEKWEASGEFIHAAYTPRKDDDDFIQPGTLVREVMDDGARERLVNNVVGHLKDGVSQPVLERAFEYWRNVDKDIGERIVKAFKKA